MELEISFYINTFVRHIILSYFMIDICKKIPRTPDLSVKICLKHAKLRYTLDENLRRPRDLMTVTSRSKVTYYMNLITLFLMKVTVSLLGRPTVSSLMALSWVTAYGALRGCT